MPQDSVSFSTPRSYVLTLIEVLSIISVKFTLTPSSLISLLFLNSLPESNTLMLFTELQNFTKCGEPVSN